MKNFKAVGFLFFAMLLSVAFTGCKDDDDDTPSGENKTEIVASWKLSTVTPENPNDSIPALDLLPTVAPCYTELVLTFTGAGKITATGCDQLIMLMSTTGYLTLGAETTFTNTADTLTITNGSNSQSFKYSISGSDLKIIVDTDQTAGTKNIVLTLKKQ